MLSYLDSTQTDLAARRTSPQSQTLQSLSNPEWKVSLKQGLYLPEDRAALANSNPLARFHENAAICRLCHLEDCT